MSRIRYVVVMLSGILLILLSLIVQVLLVLVVQEVVTEYPPLRYLNIPYSLAAVLSVLCLQVVLGCVLLIVRRIWRKTFYEKGTLLLIDLLTVAMGVAGVIPIVVIQHLNWAENINPFPLILFSWLLVFLTPAVIILLRTLRGIYVKAAADHHELEQVV